MKKAFLLILTFLLFVTTFSSYAFAFENTEIDNNIEASEIAIVQANMEVRNLWGSNFNVYLLYDTDGIPRFLLGTSDNGYIILERDSYQFHESGEINPFEDFMQAKKYYGGPLHYYCDASEKKLSKALATDGVYDILGMTCVNTLEKFTFRDETEMSQESTSSIQSVTTSGETRVSNSYNFIRRRAFGYNNDNTCSAVAVGIALNYLTLNTGKAFVPSSWIAEYRNNGNPKSSSDLSSLYPKAYALHKYLVDNCGMGAMSYADSLQTPLNKYIAAKVSSNYGLKLSWTLAPRASTIKSNINADKPVLITTTLAGDYSWHTMVAYGYRDTSGSTELLVHTGWYSSKYNGSSNNNTIYYQTETWISEGYATYGYYFSYN